MATADAKNQREQALLVKTLVSNSTFDRGSLSPTFIKPFDVQANGGKTGDWLLRLDSVPLPPLARLECASMNRLESVHRTPKRQLRSVI
jgi:hypothetical protein